MLFRTDLRVWEDIAPALFGPALGGGSEVIAARMTRPRRSRVGWVRHLFGRAGRSKELAERLTTRGWFKVTAESAALSDRQTVQRWLRELRPERDQQILVHRSWGTVVAVADRRHPVGVFLSDGDKSWVAAPPGADNDRDLTPEQVAHVVLDALTAPGRPGWPEWHFLV